MASSSSSTKKAAKLAQKGQGRKVRFQGGVVFPIAIAVTLVVGLALIVYGRQTLPAADESPPTRNDHWHHVYGFNLCGEWYQLAGDLEETDSNGNLVNVNFRRTGIHSHDDGVIHWHPFTSAATGKNATLGVFLETYEVELGNEELKFPDQNILGGNQEWIEGETMCDGEEAELSVVAWQNFTDTDDGRRYIANMDEIHTDNDGMVFSIYFAPKDTEQVMPPWAQDLPELSQTDLTPEDLEGEDPVAEYEKWLEESNDERLQEGGTSNVSTDDDDASTDDADNGEPADDGADEEPNDDDG